MGNVVPLLVITAIPFRASEVYNSSIDHGMDIPPILSIEVTRLVSRHDLLDSLGPHLGRQLLIEADGVPRDRERNIETKDRAVDVCRLSIDVFKSAYTTG